MIKAYFNVIPTVFCQAVSFYVCRMFQWCLRICSCICEIASHVCSLLCEKIVSLTCRYLSGLKVVFKRSEMVIMR